jgi:predicted DNA-binding transcriptional regulator AlpA
LKDLLDDPRLALALDPATARERLVELAGQAAALKMALELAAHPLPLAYIPAPDPPAQGNGGRLLAPGEAALALGLSVAELGRRKGLPFRVKLGRRTVRYAERGLQEWLEKGGHFETRPPKGT